MGNVLSVTRTSDLAPLSRFVTSAILDPTRVDVLSMGLPESQMPTTARSAPRWRKTGMDAPES